MEPNFHNMQLVILDKRFSKESLQMGDVIAFRCDGLKSILVKRIAAVPGQSVVIRNHTLYIDNIPASQYKENEFRFGGLLSEKITLGDGEYIVIGDNVAESKDSRYPEVGIVSADSIIGKLL